MQQIIQDRLSAQAANSLLNETPEKIKTALLSYAIEMDYPLVKTSILSPPFFIQIGLVARVGDSVQQLGY